MEIPSTDPTGYCRLCFARAQLRWLLQSINDPLVAQIQTCLGVELSPEVDFPCTVCRVCSGALETFEALKERAKVCDAALRNSRQPQPVAMESADSYVIEYKEECVTPEPELIIDEDELSPAMVVVPNPQETSNAELSRNSINTIMVGDIKVELLDVRSDSGNAGSSSSNKPNDKPKQTMKCQYCKQTFCNGTGLAKHVQSKHSSKQYAQTLAAAVAAERLRQPQKRPGEFQPISPKELRKQMNMQSRPANQSHYKCNVCNAQFRQWNSFQKHKNSHTEAKSEA